jgi:putative ABC transport system permease protein
MVRSRIVRDFRTGLKLSFSDLYHEWKLSVCLIFAIAGVIAPLLLLFGLKYGTFTTLRIRLVEDPKNREIIPLSTIEYREKWFQEVAARPDVAFLLPKTREIAVIIYVQLAVYAKEGISLKSKLAGLTKLDAVPTGPGDTLLLENGAKIPGEGQCVLTRLASETIGAKRGDRLECIIDRKRFKKHESVSFFLDVIDVLPDRAGAEKTIFIPLFLVDAIETYRDGGAVPRYGWPGDLDRVNPTFDGFTLVFKNPLPLQQQLSLTATTGLRHIREIRADEAFDIIGLSLPNHLHSYLLYNLRDSVGFESLNAVASKLKGQNAILIPYVNPLKVMISGKTGARDRQITLSGYWASKETLKMLGHPSLPAFEPLRQRQNAEQLLKIVLPAHSGVTDLGKMLNITVGDGNRSLSFPVRVTAEIKGIQNAFVPAELGGIINTFLKQKKSRLFFDKTQKEFLLDSHDYVGFRMYARSIDDVEPLRSFLTNQGIDVLTKAYEIERVRSVDHGLTRIFWLVAVVGISGCLATLAASFASSVERKRRDLGIMRLMGISGWLIFQVPVSQALIIGTSGFVVALSAFFVISRVINQIFGENLSSEGQMCILEPMHFGIAFLGTLAIVLFSSFFAAWQATRIDPADVIRDE